jgi:hypothetical protein
MIVVRWQGFVATAFSLAVVQSYAAGGQLPKEVASHVADMNEQCESYGGKPGQSGTWEPFEGKSKFHAQSLVEHSTLARGRVEVWVIDEGRYQCSKAASLFSGSGGAQVYVFARLKDGSVKQVLMQGAYGIEMRLAGQSSELLLGVGGPLCGQSGDHGHGDSIYCKRPLAWDTSAQKMDFAPLSEIKFPSNETAPK